MTSPTADTQKQQHLLTPDQTKEAIESPHRTIMSDETFLESFMEHITALPNEVKRNLELMKVLDRSCSALLEDLQRRQQEYLDYAEDRAMSLELVVEPVTDNSAMDVDDDDDEAVLAGMFTPTAKSSNQPHDVGFRAAVRVPGDASVPAVVPTTEEMQEYVLADASVDLFQTIQKLQTDALQQSEEKVAIAIQTHGLVDGIVQRLDADLAELETLLQSTGAFYVAVEGAAGTGNNPKPGDLAAIQVNPTSAPNDWILAKIITHDPQTGYYKLSDEDIESNKIFHLPESQVVVLTGNSELKLTRGDAVFAIYPDTTSFYPATVVQPPPRRTTSGSANSVEPFCTVHFVDDSDEHGITHEKAVLMKHVMLPPYGVAVP